MNPFGRGLSGISRLTVTKDRPGFVRPVSLCGKRTGEVHLSSHDEGRVSVRIEPAADTGADIFRPTFLMERVSRFLETQTEPASQTVVERSVEGKIEAVRRALDLLVTEGFVERTRTAQLPEPHACEAVPGGRSVTPPTPSPPRPGCGQE